MNKQAFLLNGGARISWDIENQKIAKETENFTIRLRFYLTRRCRILLRLYHCQVRPNQSLCTHWNSVKVYWTDVLTPLTLSRATTAYKSKIITTWTNGIYGYPVIEIVPRILQQNLPFLLLDHESLKWHVPVFFFIRKPLYAFGFDVNLN